VLSLVIMFPVAQEVGSRLQQSEAELSSASIGKVVSAVSRASEPVESFLEKHCHPRHLQTFTDVMARSKPGEAGWSALVPAFVISQLHEAFRMGFVIFLPFLVIDMLVASILLSLGMHMLSPTSVSLPFKLLLFVFVDGWSLIGTNLLGSYF